MKNAQICLSPGPKSPVHKSQPVTKPRRPQYQSDKKAVQTYAANSRLLQQLIKGPELMNKPAANMSSGLPAVVTRTRDYEQHNSTNARGSKHMDNFPITEALSQQEYVYL